MIAIRKFLWLAIHSLIWSDRIVRFLLCRNRFHKPSLNKHPRNTQVLLAIDSLLSNVAILYNFKPCLCDQLCKLLWVKVVGGIKKSTGGRKGGGSEGYVWVGREVVAVRDMCGWVGRWWQ